LKSEAIHYETFSNLLLIIVS